MLRYWVKCTLIIIFMLLAPAQSVFAKAKGMDCRTWYSEKIQNLLKGEFETGTEKILLTWTPYNSTGVGMPDEGVEKKLAAKVIFVSKDQLRIVAIVETPSNFFGGATVYSFHFDSVRFAKYDVGGVTEFDELVGEQSSRCLRID